MLTTSGGYLYFGLSGGLRSFLAFASALSTSLFSSGAVRICISYGSKFVINAVFTTAPFSYVILASQQIKQQPLTLCFIEVSSGANKKNFTPVRT